MNQRTYLSIFIGFALLITALVLFVTLFINGSSPNSSTDSNSDFPVIYLALAVIAGMMLIFTALSRLRK